jgi:hypothetical protein
MKTSTIKGLVHLGLTVVSAAETVTSTSRWRTFLLGLATGWHANATLYHFCIEDEETNERRGQSRVPRKRNDSHVGRKRPANRSGRG